MNTYGLIGKNLSHSYSPEYFKEKFRRLKIDAEYKLFDIESIEEFPEIIRQNPNLSGLNVTIPFKRSIKIYMDSISDPVHISGSLNTIKFTKNKGRTLLTGYNTDIIGFEKTLKPIIKGRKDIRAMILGTGGSSNSVAYVLRKLGILFHFISRNPSKILHSKYNWIDKDDVKNNTLIINTTPIGMFPELDSSPDIPYEYLTPNHILYDLIYNPADTMFLKRGKEHGATCINGQRMLEIQADASWKIWKK